MKWSLKNFGRSRLGAAGESLVPPADCSTAACPAVFLTGVFVSLLGGIPEVLQDSSKTVIKIQLLQVLF